MDWSQARERECRTLLCANPVLDSKNNNDDTHLGIGRKQASPSPICISIKMSGHDGGCDGDDHLCDVSQHAKAITIITEPSERASRVLFFFLGMHTRWIKQIERESPCHCSSFPFFLESNSKLNNEWNCIVVCVLSSRDIINTHSHSHRAWEMFLPCTHWFYLTGSSFSRSLLFLTLSLSPW